MACQTDSYDSSQTPLDSDSDGICDLVDSDDDEDGVEDFLDIFPLNPEEWSDADEDGVGDNSDELLWKWKIVGCMGIRSRGRSW